MKVISDRFFVMLALMMASPLLLGMVLSEPYLTIATLGINFAMLFYMRKSFKSLTGNLFGGKMKYQCLTCQGTKFDGSGTCHRCGGKSKKPI